MPRSGQTSPQSLGGQVSKEFAGQFVDRGVGSIMGRDGVDQFVPLGACR